MDEKMKLYVTTVLLLCIFANYSEGFNVETKHYTVYREATNSMFGFSVAEHIDSFENGWAIIGAPQAQTNQLEVEEGGAVYRCDITRDNGCTVIEFDPHGNHRRNYSKSGEIDNKSHQWFGATVSTSFEHGGPIMACAPRYIWYSTTLSRREPIGTCYITKNSFSSPKEISPCRTKHWGYHRQGSCQAGLGAALSKDGKRMYIGAPGSWYWQGQAFSINWHPKYRFLPPGNATYQPDPEGQVITQWVDGLKPVMFTHESPSYADDSYLGYSVTSGEFLGNGDKGFAVGMPRGNELTGKVLLFTSEMKNWLNITGSQMGSYFGYSIIACDVDGDRQDDLIVGAPMFTIPDNPEMMFETGRIYIIRQGFETDKFVLMETRDGLTNRGRFGLSLASLNDIDQDGFGDFAVGAPYGGAKGRGAVYIYRGSRDGVLETYSQVIDAEHVESPVSTFGFSIAGGMDLDGNKYPDIVIGAYESSSAMFFRSRPVINIDAYMKFNSTSKLISLEQKNCKLSDRTTVPCLEIEGCLSFSGGTARDQYRLNVQYVLDTKKPKSPRLFFIEHESKNSINRTITLRRDQQLCHPFKVYISPNIRDKLTSIDAEMRLSLIDEVEDYRRQRDPQAPLTSVLATRTSKKDSLSIFKECGEDNICIPDLQMHVQPSVNKYLLGSGDTLELDVTVKNAGEDAFEAMFNLKLPPGIDYTNIRSNKTDIPVQCSPPKQSTNYTMRCDIGNPLPHDKFVHFKVILQPVTSQGMKAIYEFEMEANSTNPDNKNTQNDNYYHLALPIWVQTELFIEGTSKPKDIHFDFDDYNIENVTTDAEFGPLVTHNYTIRNDGPSNIIAAEAFLTWPAETLANDIFVYLLEQPETSPSVQCAEANWNSLSLKLEGKQRLYGGGTFQESLIGEKQIGRVNAESHGFGTQQTGGSFHAEGGKYGSGYTETSSGTVVTSSGGRFSSSFSENKSSSSSSSEGHSGSTHGQVIFQQGSSSSEHGGGVAAGLGREGGLREFEETRYSESHGGSSMGGGQQVGMGGSRYEETRYTQSHGGQATAGGYETVPGGGQYEETRYTQSHGGSVSAGQQAGIGDREYEETRYTQSSGGSLAVGGQHSGIGGGGRYEETRYTQSHGGNVMTGGQSTGIGGGRYEETRYQQGLGGGVATGGQQTELGGQYEETRYQQGLGGGVATGGQQTELGGQYEETRFTQTHGGGVVAGGQQTGIGNGQYEETRYQQSHGGSVTTGGQQIGLGGGKYEETRYTQNHGERVTTGEQIGGGRYEETKHSQNHGGNTGIYGTQILEGTRIIDLGHGTGVRDGKFEQTSHSTVHGGVAHDNSQFRENRTHGGQFQHEWSYGNRQQGNVRNENEQSISERQRYDEEQRLLQVHRLQLARQRQEDEQRTKLERQRLETERQRDRVQGEATYGFERHYMTDSELPSGGHFQQGSTASGTIDGIVGNREYSFETTSDNYQGTKLRGIAQGLEKFFSTLDLGSPAVTTHSRNGKEYVSFEGRFRLAQGRQCIQFRNNQVFELLDSDGAPSLSTGSSEENTERFTTIEGEIVVEDDKNIYIRLTDGRKFRIPGTFTYKEERTYTVGGGSREDYPRSYNYGKEITHERHSETENVKPYGSTYRTETYGREYKSEEHKSSGGQVHEIYGDNEPANYLDRYPREKSVDDLERMVEWNRDFEDVKRRARASTHSRYDGRFHSRERRAVVGVENPEISKILPKCASANCVTLRCTFGSLEKGQEVWIAMRSRLNAKTLNKIAKNENLKVSTQLTARVTQQPFIGDVIVAEVKDHEVFTTVHPSAPSSSPDVVPLWVVVLSACAGTIILLLLVYLLYKCGFFKRNRPNDAPEREPLNKNGHYSN